MNKKLLITALLIASPAAAQDITLKVQPFELNLIGQSLDAKKQEIDNLVGKLRQQYTDQTKPPAQDAPKSDIPVPTPAPLPKQ